MINEIFVIIQGEGKTTGQRRLLIRFNGCNLRCSFCDTKYTWGIGDNVINLEKYNKILKKEKYWMITGGEPLLYQKEIEKMIKIYNPKWVEIETNGTIKIQNKFLLKKINLYNISPKEKKFQLNKNINVIPYILEQKNKLKDYIVKFVVDKNNKFIYDIIKKYNIPKDKVYLMPLNKFNKKDKEIRNKIYDICIKKGFNFSPRLQILLFGNLRNK